MMVRESDGRKGFMKQSSITFSRSSRAICSSVDVDEWMGIPAAVEVCRFGRIATMGDDDESPVEVPPKQLSIT